MGMKYDSQSSLFNKVQQKILKLLYLNTDSDFYTNEIIKISESGTGAVQRELKKLTLSGIIVSKKVGNQIRYQANQELPFFLELKSIIIKTFGLSDVLREALKPLENQLRLAFIYGSFAKQMESSVSDIDLMLIGQNLIYNDVFPMLESIEKDLGRKINPTIYSYEEWSRKRKKGNAFLNKIIEQPKIFLKGSENEPEGLL